MRRSSRSCAGARSGWSAWPASCGCSAPSSSARFPTRSSTSIPSLLPAFPGLDAQHQAWAHGVKVSGATVHLVDCDLDAGPIVLQRPVPVLDDDTPDALAARILVEEHRLYPEAIGILLAGGWRVEGRRFVGALEN